MLATESSRRRVGVLVSILAALTALLLCALSPAFSVASQPVKPAALPATEPIPVAPYSANPPSNKAYRVCPPPTTKRASCAAIDLPAKAANQLAGPALEGSGEKGGYSPADLTSAYKLSSKGGAGQTIAIVIAFDNPKAAADLAVFRTKYGLPPCTEASGCFKKVNQKGEAANYPEPSVGWAAETALDLDMASTSCPECKLLLVEANDNSLENLAAAEDKAASLGPAVISNSWSALEWSGETSQDAHYTHAGIPSVFSSGDAGYQVEYPAASSNVVSVGGTALRKDPAGSRGWTEETWIGAGSGCSLYEPKPKWQKDSQCGKRAIADVSAVASPETPVSVYFSYEASGWLLFGGTSASAPLVSGIIAQTSSTIRAMGAEAFYNQSIPLFDITVGSNGVCTPPALAEYLCTGALGYDGPTGNGAPGLIHAGTPVVASRAAGATTSGVTLEGTVNPEGSATTYQFEYGPTTAYGEKVPASAASAGSGTANVTVSKVAANLFAETTYHYRLKATNSKGTVYSEDHTFATRGTGWPATPSYSSSFGTKGTGDGQFEEPTSVAISPINGLAAVADQMNNRIEVFTEAGTFVRKFGTKGPLSGQLTSPRGVTFDSKGNIWVTDSLNRVQEFSETGSPIREFGIKGSGNGQLNNPGAIAVDSKGNVWVADSGNDRLEEFSETGVYLRQVSAGIFPTGVTIDQQGNVWSVNSGEGFVLEVNAEGTVLRKFGTPGKAPGQLWDTGGIGVDASGNVWVANANYEFAGPQFARIEIFSKTGAYEGYFGSLGVANQQLQYPKGLAVDPRGYVWIVDDLNNQIDKWKVPSKWPPSYSSTFGTSGTGPGHFNEPTGIAVNPVNGITAVADSGHNLVQEFTASGEFIRTFGSTGSLNGQFNSPRGVAFDAKGNLWVADALNGRIQEFSETGTFIRAFGTSGSGNGELKWPGALAVDPSGNVWVADSGNYRIQEFTESGTYVRKFSVGDYTQGVAVDPEGNVWNISATAYVEEHSSTGTLLRKFGGKVGSGPGEFYEPRGITVDGSGNVWVADGSNHRIQVFSKTGEYLTKFGSFGSGAEQMDYPSSVAVDPRGYVWIANTLLNRIDKWKVPSKWPPSYSSTFGTFGTGPGHFKEPFGVAVNPVNGTVAVADTTNDLIQEFNASGEFIRTFGSTGSLNGLLDEPRGITFDSKGNLWVADAQNFRIQEFSETGSFIRAFGKNGTGNGEFKWPAGVAVDSSGNVWVADSTNYRIQEFTESGTYVRKFSVGDFTQGVAVDSEGNVWNISATDYVEEHSSTGTLLRKFGGKAGSGPGEFYEPRGITVDGSGNVWVADGSNHRIQVFSKTGEYLTQFGSFGSGAGQMDYPSTVAVDPRGYAWIANSQLNRIDKWLVPAG